MRGEGERGRTGDVGASGQIGETGQTGAGGERGAPGQPGPVGERGQKGDHGQPGEAGMTGRTGASGAAGAEGAPGQPGLSPDPRAFIKSVRRLLYLLVGATVLLYLALGGLMVYTLSQAHTNQDALCALRGDQERAIAASHDFLVEHPNGIPGISREQIEQGIRNRRETYEALSVVNCPAPEVP